MRPDTGKLAQEKKAWITPRLRRLDADLTSVAGRVFAPGDGNSGSGKSLVPPGS